MKVGYLIPQFPAQTHSFFWREIKALERLGAEITLLSTRRNRARPAPHAWAKAAQAQTLYLVPPSVTDILGTPAVLAAQRTHLSGRTRQERTQIAVATPFAAKLRRLCVEREIDHIHVGSCGWAALIASLCHEIGGPAYSLTLHSSVKIFGPSQDFKWRHAAFGIAVSAAVLDELRTRVRELPERIVVQPMGVETEKFCRTVPYVPWSPGTAFKIFACGRLNRAKGHEILIEAVRHLRAEGVDARLAIAGEDDEGGTGYRKHLEARIAQAKLSSAVTLLGAVDEGTLISHMQTAQVFALASLAEAIGVAFMEAMSCELPTIGTETGGIPELISHGKNGLLVPPGDVGALTGALKQVMKNGELARSLGQAGRATVVEQYQATIGAERVLQEIMAAHRR